MLWNVLNRYGIFIISTYKEFPGRIFAFVCFFSFSLWLRGESTHITVPSNPHDSYIIANVDVTSGCLVMDIGIAAIPIALNGCDNGLYGNGRRQSTFGLPPYTNASGQITQTLASGIDMYLEYDINRGNVPILHSFYPTYNRTHFTFLSGSTASSSTWKANPQGHHGIRLLEINNLTQTGKVFFVGQSDLNYLLFSGGKPLALVKNNRKVLTFYYDATGRISSIVDDHLNDIRITYPSTYEFEIEIAGKKINYLTNPLRKIRLRVDSTNFQDLIRFGYNGSQQLWYAEDVLTGQQRTFTYTSNAQPSVVKIMHSAGGQYNGPQVEFIYKDSTRVAIAQLTYEKLTFTKLVGGIIRVSEILFSKRNTLGQESDSFKKISYNYSNTSQPHLPTQLTSVTTPATGLASTFKSTYSYNSFGQLTEITLGGKRKATYQYDGYGQLTQSIDDSGNLLTMAYNEFGPISVSYPGLSASLQYNPISGCNIQLIKNGRVFRWSHANTLCDPASFTNSDNQTTNFGVVTGINGYNGLINYMDNPTKTINLSINSQPTATHFSITTINKGDNKQVKENLSLNVSGLFSSSNSLGPVDSLEKSANYINELDYKLRPGDSYAFRSSLRIPGKNNADVEVTEFGSKETNMSEQILSIHQQWSNFTPVFVPWQ